MIQWLQMSWLSTSFIYLDNKLQFYLAYVYILFNVLLFGDQG